MSGFSILQSSFGALDTMTQASARNIANINTDGYRAERVTLENGPSGTGVRAAAIQKGDSFESDQSSSIDLPREFSQLIIIENAYSATAAAIRTTDEMTGSILNVKV